MLVNLGSNTVRVPHHHPQMLDCLTKSGKPTSKKQNIRPYPQHFPVLQLRKQRQSIRSTQKEESSQLRFYTLMKPKLRLWPRERETQRTKLKTTQSTHLMEIRDSNSKEFGMGMGIRRRYKSRKVVVMKRESKGEEVSGWDNQDDLYQF